jgi:cytochrome c-type biogenesis protein CcmH
MASFQPFLLRATFHAGALALAGLVALTPARALARDPGPTPAASSDELAAQVPATGERSIERRLFAPCCYTQTLDLHESEIAHDLRLEIRRRLGAGEAADVIEQSLVRRYGERIRAVPEQDPMRLIAPAMLLSAGLAGILVLRLLRRWKRRSEEMARLSPVVAAGPDAYDDRLDAELRALD